MSWVLQVLIAVFLSQGWAITNYLVTKQILSPSTQILIIFALVICLVIQQTIINRPKPKDRSVVEKQREIAENCLNSLFDEYKKVIAVGGTAAGVANTVRVNLALPTQSKLGFWYMRIYYAACQAGLTYSCEELNLRWKKGVGAIGYCWKSKDITLFDSVNTKFKAPANAIPKSHEKIVGNLNSVISIPIIGKNGKVIGILNLDSTDNITNTKFGEQEVIKLLRAFSDTLQPICFFDGVKQ